MSDFKHTRKCAEWSEPVQRIETDTISENMISQKRLRELGLFRQENTTDMREDSSLKRNKGYHKKEVINCSPCPLQIRIGDRTVSKVILFQ